MADFHQEGIITTLHSLYEAFDREEYLGILEKKLEEYSHHIRICLLLPCLFSEIHAGDVLRNILYKIREVSYLHRVVVALGGTSDESEFNEAKEFFSILQTPSMDVKVVWVDGPRIQRLFRDMEDAEISVGVQGKGQSVWIALGYIFALEDCDVIGLHDCDIQTYDRILLGRLIEPTANPNNDFEFCKGYYTRISPTERTMKGRVTRLFVTPFADAMTRITRNMGLNDLSHFFSYHRTFNYPLSGEFSFTTRLAKNINIAYDWGLEVSTLSEVFKRVKPQKIAQIDLVPNYEHKHQEVNVEDPDRGLHRMVIDIVKFYLNYARSHGLPLDDGFVDMVAHTYCETAHSFIKSYSDDSEVNGLNYDRYNEELMVKHFKSFLWDAWKQLKGRQHSTIIPSWNRVLYGMPDIYSRIIDVVEGDNL